MERDRTFMQLIGFLFSCIINYVYQNRHLPCVVKNKKAEQKPFPNVYTTPDDIYWGGKKNKRTDAHFY